MNEDTRLKDEERQPCEVWTRVMGYHRPTSEYNPGKRSEHEERTHFEEHHTTSNDSLHRPPGCP